jgi:nicotinate-nucleotide adenylyltransferase
LGHRKIADLVDDSLELDALVFIPNYQNPLKTRKPVEPEIRIEMISKGIEDKCNFYCCTYEVDQNKVCYTYDTLTLINESLPGVEIFFIMGADNLESLKSWKNYEELGGLCQFVLVSRKGTLDQSIIDNLPNNFNVHFVKSTEELEQNSSAIREDLSAYAIYLDPAVYKIIKKHGIYQ